MGLPIGRLIVGSNRNDILARFFDSGELAMTEVHPTLSPSMDIQVSSNFERLIFDLYGRDGARVAQAMAEFRLDRRLDLGEARWQRALEQFAGHRIDDERTKGVIGEIHAATGELIDPHSAAGVQEIRRAPG